MAVLGLSHTAKLIVHPHGSRRHRQFDLLRDFSRAVDLDDATRAGFNDHHVSIGERLAGVDLGLLRRLVFPDDFLFARHLDRAADVAEENISIRQPPTVLRMFVGDLPLDLPLGGDERDFASGRVGAEKRMCGVRTHRRC